MKFDDEAFRLKDTEAFQAFVSIKTSCIEFSFSTATYHTILAIYFLDEINF